jgi:hypothetical protein
MKTVPRRLQGSFLLVSGLAPLAVLILAAGANPPSGAPPASAPSTEPAPNPQSAPPAVSPLDEPLRLIAAAQQAYQGVTDYTCRLVKQERMRGQLQPEQVILMSVRTRPFSIDLRFMEPRSVAGQEAVYVTGRNNGMMRVHARGIASLAGFISLDPHDPRALENSRHAITEAGIGNLIDRFARGWEQERRLNKTQVRLADFSCLNRMCTRVETVHPERSAAFLYYRSFLYLDRETHLPVRVENYDWPRPGGAAEGDLMEVFTFADLRLNVGLRDEVFNK